MDSGDVPLNSGSRLVALDQPGPALRPAVADPVRRDQLRHRPLVARGQLVLRPAVQPVVERLGRRQRVVEQLHHLVDGHAVVGDLEREVRVVAHLARHLVAQLEQLDQARLERPADLLRRRPDALPLVEIARLAQDVVDVVGRDRLARSWRPWAAGRRCSRRGCPTACVSASTRLATTSGIVPGFSAAASSSLRSWRTVRSSSCFSFFSSALVCSMMVVDADQRGQRLVGAGRAAPMCSGVTSVAAAQSASEALVDTGASRPVTVARKASASFWAGPRLPRLAAGGGPPALDGFGASAAPAATATPADRQATRMPSSSNRRSHAQKLPQMWRAEITTSGLVDERGAW